MMKFILGVILGVLLVPAAFYLYMRSGRAPVATAAPPMPFERFFAKTALHATLASQAPKTLSTKADEATLMTGAHAYVENCAVCHGLPGHPPTSISKGMFPRPPQLFQQDGMVTDDPVGVTYWKVKHGIRLSGMPAFDGSLTGEQIYAVSALLANADKLPASVQQALVPAPPAVAAAPPSPRTASKPRK